MRERALHFVMAFVLVLGMALSVTVALPTSVGAATPGWTGNAETDFTGGGILIIPDPDGQNVNVTYPLAPPGTISGWDMKDLRLTYNSVTDILYVGVNFYVIAGDADGDGDPSGGSYFPPATGQDNPNLGITECISVYFDLDKDGTWDVIGGVPSGTLTKNITAFTVAYYYSQNQFGPPVSAELLGHKGSYCANPSAAKPDFEFTFTNWSTLAGDLGLTDTSLGGFRVHAFAGSLDDDIIGEDNLEYEQNPHTIASIVCSAAKVHSGDSVTLNVSEANPVGPFSVNITSPQVAVTKNGVPLAASPLVAPPSSGDNANGVLEPGETWHWNNIAGGAITGPTTFLARGSGIAPGDFPVNYITDPLEEVNVIANSVSPNTTTTIAVSATKVKLGDSVTLNVTEANTGTDNLTAPRVEVRKNGVPIAASPLQAPPSSGDAAPLGVLNVGETWRWNNVPGGAITGPTTFEARGFGTDSLLQEVSYAADPVKYSGELDTVGVSTSAPNTTTTITVSATKVKLGDPVTLNVTEANTGTDNLTAPRVEVRKNGVPIAASPLQAPPSSGDAAPLGVLNVGETWRWNNVPGGAITGPTTFEARGFGTDSMLQEVSFAQGYLSELDTVDVDTIWTITTITAYPTKVASGESVSLNVTEQNTGSDNLTLPRVEVRQDGVVIATLVAPPTSGDAAPLGVLNAGETWRWNNVPSDPITGPTTFEALGFGIDSLGHEVSFAKDYTSERDTVDVEVSGEGCLQICKFEDANVNGVWDPLEEGLPGWRFHVTGDGYNEWVTTGPDGCVLLDGLTSGEYTVTEELRAGWYNTRPGGDPPYDQEVTVEAGAECAQVEFGNREKIPDVPPLIPTMNQWGIIAMIIVFAGLLVWTVRRKRSAS